MHTHVIGGIESNEHSKQVIDLVAEREMDRLEVGDRILFCENDGCMSAYVVSEDKELKLDYNTPERYGWLGGMTQTGGWNDNLADLTETVDLRALYDDAIKTDDEALSDCVMARLFEVNAVRPKTWDSDDLNKGQKEWQQECQRKLVAKRLSQHLEQVEKVADMFVSRMDQMVELEHQAKEVGLLDTWQNRGAKTHEKLSNMKTWIGDLNRFQRHVHDKAHGVDHPEIDFNPKDYLMIRYSHITGAPWLVHRAPFEASLKRQSIERLPTGDESTIYHDCAGEKRHNKFDRSFRLAVGIHSVAAATQDRIYEQVGWPPPVDVLSEGVTMVSRRDWRGQYKLVPAPTLTSIPAERELTQERAKETVGVER